jgi:hypothetical protein
MKRFFALSLLLGSFFSACGPLDSDDAPPAPGATASAPTGAEAISTETEALVVTGQNRCTPEKQLACDACAAGCDPLCSQPDGGGRAGGCIGLFCPSRCDACILSCYTTCGKCTPSNL